MSRIPPPKEQSGCLQTIIISRMIIQILLVPLLMILGAIFSILLALYAYAENPLFGLGIIVAAAAGIAIIARWEYNRAIRDLPPDEQ